jgi:hypothetical protein
MQERGFRSRYSTRRKREKKKNKKKKPNKNYNRTKANKPLPGFTRVVPTSKRKIALAWSEKNCMDE